MFNFPNYNNNNVNNNFFSKSFEGYNNNSKNNSDEYKCKKPFIERPGDWICFNCHNINFAFRTKCNRCHITKNNNKILFKRSQLMLVNNKLF